MCSLQDMKDTIDDLNGAHIPFVMTNCYAGKDQINYVGVDDFEIGNNGAAYLAGRGHARIALISGAARSPMTPQVLSGFKAGLKKAGKKFESRLHFCSDYDAATSFTTRSSSGSPRSNPPTAIFCADDQLVPDVYRTLEELQKQIPADVSVLGRGNLPIGTVLKPHLTTIAIPAFEMGKKAAELLIDVVAANPKIARRISLKAPLIERESA